MQLEPPPVQAPTQSWAERFPPPSILEIVRSWSGFKALWAVHRTAQYMDNLGAQIETKENMCQALEQKVSTTKTEIALRFDAFISKHLNNLRGKKYTAKEIQEKLKANTLLPVAVRDISAIELLGIRVREANIRLNKEYAMLHTAYEAMKMCERRIAEVTYDAHFLEATRDATEPNFLLESLAAKNVEFALQINANMNVDGYVRLLLTHETDRPKGTRNARGTGRSTCLATPRGCGRRSRRISHKCSPTPSPDPPSSPQPTSPPKSREKWPRGMCLYLKPPRPPNPPPHHPAALPPSAPAPSSPPPSPPHPPPAPAG